MILDTAAKYRDTLWRNLQNLPGVLADWDTLDDDLRETYESSLVWLLRIAPEFTPKATEQEQAQIILALGSLRDMLRKDPNLYYLVESDG